jgi:hypothetical protein
MYSYLITFACIVWNSIAGPWGSSVFSFWRNFHSVFHSGCTTLHSHQWCIRVPFLPHSHQHLLLFFLRPPLWLVRWNLSTVLNCISLTVKDVEDFFIYLWAICTCFENSVQIISPYNGWITFIKFLWVLYIFWVLDLYQMNEWQRLSSII